MCSFVLTIPLVCQLPVVWNEEFLQCHNTAGLVLHLKYISVYYGPLDLSLYPIPGILTVRFSIQFLISLLQLLIVQLDFFMRNFLDTPQLNGLLTWPYLRNWIDTEGLMLWKSSKHQTKTSSSFNLVVSSFTWSQTWPHVTDIFFPYASPFLPNFQSPIIQQSIFNYVYSIVFIGITYWSFLKLLCCVVKYGGATYVIVIGKNETLHPHPYSHFYCPKHAWHQGKSIQPSGICKFKWKWILWKVSTVLKQLATD